MRKFAQQQKKNDLLGRAQNQLTDLKELLRRGSQGERGKGHRVKDFLLRAEGKKPKDGGQGKGTGRASTKAFIIDPHAPTGDLLLPLSSSDQPSGKEAMDSSSSDGIGNGVDMNLRGEQTRLKARHQEVRVEGEEDQGPTRSEVILSASEKGFATEHYHRIYHEYTQIIEEVMKREDIPLGYKYYVKRYFQLIKPR
jgi:hypothetical protein